MPIALRPAMTATRADNALIERAISSASPITRDDLMPGAGSSSYSVTTGPGFALTISPRTPKSPSTPSSAREFVSRSDLLSGWRSDALGAVNTETGGRSNLSDDRRDGGRGGGFFGGGRVTGNFPFRHPHRGQNLFRPGEQMMPGRRVWAPGVQTMTC